jgi:anaerobic selenocysteine-containing dehydrogenase
MKGGLANNHIDPNARLCMASAVTGVHLDLRRRRARQLLRRPRHADVVILWGNNPAEMHPMLFSRMIDRRARGERPHAHRHRTRRTRTTGFANDYLSSARSRPRHRERHPHLLIERRHLRPRVRRALRATFRRETDPPT